MNFQQQKETVKSKKKIVLIVSSVLLSITLVAVLVFVMFGADKKSIPGLPFLRQTPNVSLKTDYKNPFDKETQYVNPFETYKNPFVVSQ